jgi:hypothetical protein
MRFKSVTNKQEHVDPPVFSSVKLFLHRIRTSAAIRDRGPWIVVRYPDQTRARARARARLPIDE